jgi:hypothetical protein
VLLISAVRQGNQEVNILVKNQGSDGGRVKERKARRNDVRSSQKFSFGRGKTDWIFLLMMLSIVGVVQAISDCQIMNGWLPEMFDGSGDACCAQPGISCTGGSWGRIDQMYVALNLTLL